MPGAIVSTASYMGRLDGYRTLNMYTGLLMLHFRSILNAYIINATVLNAKGTRVVKKRETDSNCYAK